jgi:hypothetical protein
MKRVRALATFGLVTALGLGLADSARAQMREQIQYTTLTRRVTGGPSFPVRAILTSAEQYAKFFQTRAAPPVDFANDFLLVVDLGTQGSDGYTVRVTSIERVYSTPPVVTVKYRITKDAAPTSIRTTPQVDPAGQEQPTDLQAPAELIKVHRLTPADKSATLGIKLEQDQIRFYEDGGMDRVGFNIVARTLAMKGGFQQLTVDYAGNIKVRKGAGDAKETRVLLSELERLSTCARNATLPQLPRTIPTEQYSGQQFVYTYFDATRRKSTVQGYLNFEGSYADKLRPLSQAYDLIMGRLDHTPTRIEGTIEAVPEADAVRIQGALGLSFYLRGPLAKKLTVLAGRRVVLEAVAQLRSATEAEGVISKVIYPQRNLLAGTPTPQGNGLVLIPADKLMATPITLLGRGQELAGPEVGHTVMLDMWTFFNDRGIPTEGFVESILGKTLMPVSLRDRPEAVSVATGDLPAKTNVWVSARQGGSSGLCLAAAGTKSGWCAAQLVRFYYEPPGLVTGIDPNKTDPAVGAQVGDEVNGELDRARNPVPPR